MCPPLLFSLYPSTELVMMTIILSIAWVAVLVAAFLLAVRLLKKLQLY